MFAVLARVRGPVHVVYYVVATAPAFCYGEPTAQPQRQMFRFSATRPFFAAVKRGGVNGAKQKRRNLYKYRRRTEFLFKTLN